MRKFDSLREMVVSVEEDAARFYRSMKERTDDERRRDLFEYIASEEDGHVEVMKELVSDRMTFDAVDRAFEEARKHLLILVDKGEELDMLAKELESEERILKLAISIEEDAARFYGELLKRIDQPAFKSALERIIAEETKHFEMLSDLLHVVRRSEREDMKRSEELEDELKKAIDEDEAKKKP